MRIELEIQFDCDNAAFDDDSSEHIRIFKDVISKIERGIDDGICRDINGNKIGTFNLYKLDD